MNLGNQNLLMKFSSIKTILLNEPKLSPLYYKQLHFSIVLLSISAFAILEITCLPFLAKKMEMTTSVFAELAEFFLYCMCFSCIGRVCHPYDASQFRYTDAIFM